MRTDIIPIDSPQALRLATAMAAERLAAGEVVALPTETVYGLAADATRPEAVRRIFEVKGRPSHNPLITHVSDLPMARRCVAHWPEEADRLAAQFWPGPLTLVMGRSPWIPDEVTAGGPTVGVRLPAHPVMRETIALCGFPLAAPSANLSNQLSPTTAQHVLDGLGGRIPLILDGGPCAVGIESTVVDLTVTPPRVLRPGMVSQEAINLALGLDAGPRSLQPGPPPPNPSALRSPGQLSRHYSPKARLEIWSSANRQRLAERLRRLDLPLAQVHYLCHAALPEISGLGRVSLIPADPDAYARALYAELHACDLLGARLIILEELPDGPEWDAIRDRVARAATP